MSTLVRAVLPDGRAWPRAAAWLTVLTPFFFGSYGLANALAARREGIPALVFGWETSIPFWEWTIVPYWSIDALYGLSLFVCADRAELDTHGRRLVTAQAVAVACFVLFPLRFSFPQPAVEGTVAGFLFDAVRAFDKPFNQAPSLHIALLIILWDLYGRHVRGPGRLLLHGWFTLIGLSVLTTYQHHFVDVPTGALLGLLCVFIWPNGRPSPLAEVRWTADPTRRRLGLIYGSAALATAALALLRGGGFLWLLWPAVSLALVSLTYAALGPAGFGKDERGRLPAASIVLYGPYLAAAWANSRLWTRRNPTPREIADGVWLGRVPAPREFGRFVRIIDLSAEMPGSGDGARWSAFPCLDLVPPEPGALREAAAAIERSRSQGSVLVCCALGFSRSAAALATWLVTTGRATDPATAERLMRKAGARVVLHAPERSAIAAASGAPVP